MVRPHALRSSHATHPAQLTCSNGAGAIRNGKLESFTTGSLFTDIPTYNASGPVNCTLLLDVLDWLGQTGAATANITVSTRKVGPRALRPSRSSPSAYAWVQRLCGDSAATRSSQVAGPRHSEPWLGATHHLQVTNPPPPVPVISSGSLNAVALNDVSVNLHDSNCTTGPCDYTWMVGCFRQAPRL